MSTRERVNVMGLADLATPWSVLVVSTLGVADHLIEGDRSATELAGLTGVDPDALGRVLRHLTTHGLFEPVGPERFALSETGRELLDPAVRIGLDLNGIGGRMARAWAGLPSAVETGRAGYAEVIGLPFWQDLEAHPEVAESFDELMGPAGHGVPGPDVLPSQDWAGVRRVVDVGGGTGRQLAEILRARPELVGTLVDLPRVVDGALEVLEEAGVADRVEVVPGSFFEPLPSGGDLYLLRSVLADWPDDAAVTLLRRCAEAAAPNGRVVVSGGVSPHAGGGESDLLMLVLLGGRERTPEEFAVLASAAGLQVGADGRDGDGRFVVECGVTVPTPAGVPG